MSKLLIITILFHLLYIPVFSQDISRLQDDRIFADEILMSSSSVRSNGMGMMGVMMTDEKSFYYNPASLGFMDNEYFSSTIYLKKTRVSELGPSRFYPDERNITGYPYLNDVSFSMNLKRFPLLEDSRFNIGLGYIRHSLALDGDVILDESGDTSQNETELITGGDNFDDQVNIYSIGMSYKSIIDIGIGISYKNTNFKLNHSKHTSDLFDIGLLLQVPLDRLTSAIIGNTDGQFVSNLSLGISIVNMGSDLIIDDNTYASPQYSSFGVGLDMAIVRNNIKIAFIYPAVQYDFLSFKDNADITRLGLEFGIYEIVYLRTGWISSQDYPYSLSREAWSEFELPREPGDVDISDNSYSTTGFSISSKGIKYLLFGSTINNNRNDGFATYLLKNLNLEFQFASYKVPGNHGKKNKFYSLQLTL